MFCKYCGKQIADDASFCAYCGREVKKVQPDLSEAFKNATPEFFQEAFKNATPAPPTSENVVTIQNEDGQSSSIKFTDLQEGTTRAFELSAEFYNLEITGNKDGLSDVFEKMVPVYEKLSPFTDAWVEKDFLQAVGTMSQLMAKYRCEYSYNVDDGERFADTAVDTLKKFMDLYGSTFDDKEKLRTTISYNMACKYSAYIAYHLDYLDYAAQMVKDLPVTPSTLGIIGSCLCLKANATKDYQMVRNSMAVFEQMDQMITEAPKDKVTQDIYRFSYAWYAMMLATNPDEYPDGNFERDLVKAIRLIKKAISLMTDQEFIDMLKPDLDEYVEKL